MLADQDRIFTNLYGQHDWRLPGAKARGVWDNTKAMVSLGRDRVIDLVKQSDLRGRGGAGFPTGLKWSFMPKESALPHYLVVNADESEPGTCKDRDILRFDPHRLLEGMVLAGFAMGANTGYIYIRGEFYNEASNIEQAILEAREAGLLGEKSEKTNGWDFDIHLHRGAGAYICGEETALLDSLEGYRGQPRLKPPFPAVAGLYASPTVINNVETIANIPYIVDRGVEWFRGFGTEKSPGFKVFAVSGHVKRPGIYEAPLGITMRELLDYAGGMRDGSSVKFWLPGGSSVPLLTDEHLDLPLTYEAMAEAGTMLGTGTPMVFDQTVSVVKAVTRWLEFYKHESCGKCTPCREGTYWITGVLEKFEHGQGQQAEMETLTDLCGQIAGRSFCALGDAAATPYPAAMKYFREEFEASTHTSADEQFDPVASYIFAAAGVR